MLTRWIVETYKTLVEVALWAFMLIGGLAGAAAGGALDHGVLGFVIGVVAAFFGMAIFLGAALVLENIHERVKAIESHLKSKADG